MSEKKSVFFTLVMKIEFSNKGRNSFHVKPPEKVAKIR